MRRIIASALALPALIFVGVMPANAHDGHHAVEDWETIDTDDGSDNPHGHDDVQWDASHAVSPSDSSEIIDSHTALLTWPEGGPNLGTSVETTNLGLTVNDSATLTFDFELIDGAECAGGAPRAFVVIDGTQTNTWNHGETDCETGTASVAIATGGTIEHAGISFDNGTVGSVRVSSLEIDGEKVHFLPEHEPTEVEPAAPTSDECERVTIPGVDGVSYSVERDGETVGVEPDTSDEAPGEHTFIATADEGYALSGETDTWTVDVAECETPSPSPSPTDDESTNNDDDESKNDDDESTNDDDEKESTLPETGMSNASLVGIAGALLVAGGVLTVMGYRQRRAAKYAAQQ